VLADLFVGRTTPDYKHHHIPGSAMAQKFLQYNDRQIMYHAEGKGFPVILVHGFCEDSNMWEEFKNDLLEEQYRVIRIDLPGFGQSDVIPDISITEMAKVVHAVANHLKISKPIFVGHSMGGYVGLAYAEQYPEQLSGLSLFHSHPFEDTEEKKNNRFKSIDFINRQGHVLFVKQLIPKLFTQQFVRSNAFLLEKMIFRATRYQTAGITSALAAMANRPDRAGVLSAITVPVQFIIGTEDSAIPRENSEAQIHLPQLADIQFLEKIAHMGMFEAQKKTQRLVRQFVQFCIQQTPHQ
jgi:pimeloyl-ACP methyl ester carboxylesterase